MKSFTTLEPISGRAGALFCPIELTDVYICLTTPVRSEIALLELSKEDCIDGSALLITATCACILFTGTKDLVVSFSITAGKPCTSPDIEVKSVIIFD